jgi:hypothetical protein
MPSRTLRPRAGTVRKTHWKCVALVARSRTVLPRATDRPRVATSTARRPGDPSRTATNVHLAEPNQGIAHHEKAQGFFAVWYQIGGEHRRCVAPLQDNHFRSDWNMFGGSQLDVPLYNETLRSDW